MKLKIATIANVVYSSENVISATLPTQAGEITVLNNHISLVSLLSPGVIKVTHEDNAIEYLAISTGMIEINSNPGQDTEIIVLADQADRAGMIDLEIVTQAKERAKIALSQPQTLSEEEYKNLVADLAMQEARVKATSRLN